MAGTLAQNLAAVSREVLKQITAFHTAMGRLPLRQWVLAVPKRLHYFLHRDAYFTYVPCGERYVNRTSLQVRE